MSQINDIYAFIVKNEDGDAMLLGTVDGQKMPLVGSNIARLKKMRQAAVDVLEETNMDVVIRKFSVVSETVFWKAK